MSFPTSRGRLPRRRTLAILLALAAAASSSLLTAAAPSAVLQFPGSWSRTATGQIIDTETNNSGRAVQYVYLLLPAGADIVSGQVTSAAGYSCQVGQPNPPGGSNVIECAAPPPLYWANGQQLTISLNATGVDGTPGFQKWVSFDGSSYVGPYQVPPAPVTCNCLQLLAHAYDWGGGEIGAAGAPPGIVRMFFKLRWTLSCTAGVGGCKASLKVVPPRGHGAKVSISQKVTRSCRTCPPHFTNPSPGVSTITCNGTCAGATTGVAYVRVDSNDTLDAAHRANKDIEFQLQRTCQGNKLRRQLLVFHFDKRGRLDVKHSHL